MSDEEGDDSAGYRRPPKKHRFRKGQSGNPLGRPPKPKRSLIPRQVRNDILKTALKPLRTRTPEGEKTVVAVDALLQVLLRKAATGHLPSIRYFFSLYQTAVREHYEAHREGAYEFLEALEHGVQLAKEPVSRELIEHLNKMRSSTRSLEPVETGDRKKRPHGCKKDPDVES